MKKCYNAPEIVVVDIDSEGIICRSEQPGGSVGNGDGGGVHEGDAASYRSSLWND